MQPGCRQPQLSGLFPSGVEAAAVAVRFDLEAEFRVEEEAVSRAVASRRAEFLSGRRLARELLQRLGAPATAISVGHRRAPVWPDGFVGSIAHADSMCVGAVARRGAFASVGIDIEPDREPEEPIGETVCTPLELREAERLLTVQCASPVRAVFSAKEAVFKALFPLSGVELEFHQVSISWEPSRGRFNAVFQRAPQIVHDFGARLHGAYRISEGWIVTGAWIEATE